MGDLADEKSARLMVEKKRPKESGIERTDEGVARKGRALVMMARGDSVLHRIMGISSVVGTVVLACICHSLRR